MLFQVVCCVLLSVLPFHIPSADWLDCSTANQQLSNYRFLLATQRAKQSTSSEGASKTGLENGVRLFLLFCLTHFFVWQVAPFTHILWRQEAHWTAFLSPDKRWYQWKFWELKKFRSTRILTKSQQGVPNYLFWNSENTVEIGIIIDIVLRCNIGYSTSKRNFIKERHVKAFHFFNKSLYLDLYEMVSFHTI